MHWFICVKGCICSSVSKDALVHLCQGMHLFICVKGCIDSSVSRDTLVHLCQGLHWFICVKGCICSSVSRDAFVHLCQGMHWFICVKGCIGSSGLEGTVVVNVTCQKSICQLNYACNYRPISNMFMKPDKVCKNSFDI